MLKHILSLFLKVTRVVVHTLILYKMEVINVLKIMLLLTRDIKVKNNVTMVRGEWGGDSEERGLQELL